MVSSIIKTAHEKVVYDEQVSIEEFTSIFEPLGACPNPAKGELDLIIPIPKDSSIEAITRSIKENIEDSFSELKFLQIRNVLDSISQMTNLHQDSIAQMTNPIVGCSFQYHFNMIKLLLQDGPSAQEPKTVFVIKTKSIRTDASQNNNRKQTKTPIIADKVIEINQDFIKLQQARTMQGFLESRPPEKLNRLKKVLQGKMSEKELEEEIESRGMSVTISHIDNLRLKKRENPILVINGKEIELNGSSRSRTTAETLFINLAVNGLSGVVSKDILRDELFKECTIDNIRANRRLSNYIKEINEQVGRYLTGEINLITPVKGGYRLNPDLLKKQKN